MSMALVLLPVLGTLSSCLVPVSDFDTIVSASSSYTSLCHIRLLCLRSLLFSNERQRWSGSREEGRWGWWGRLGEIEGKGTHRIGCMRKISIFKKEKNSFVTEEKEKIRKSWCLPFEKNISRDFHFLMFTECLQWSTRANISELLMYLQWA